MILHQKQRPQHVLLQKNIAEITNPPASTK